MANMRIAAQIDGGTPTPVGTRYPVAWVTPDFSRDCNISEKSALPENACSMFLHEGRGSRAGFSIQSVSRTA
jgi:hypothetical protein